MLFEGSRRVLRELIEDCEDANSKLLLVELDIIYNSSAELTCSGDVSIKFGGPLRQLMNIGTTFFRNSAYVGPDT